MKSTINDSELKMVKKCLAKPDIHQRWAAKYRTAENDKFFECTFDYIARVINAPNNSTILDVGCGYCTHSIRLANRGFFVQAVDFSENALKKARTNVKNKGLEGKISLLCGDALSLPYANETFGYILCWGVLMHIPDVERAISELTRVLRPGGILVIGENNMHSLHAIIRRGIRQFLGKDRAIVKKTPAGVERWYTYSTDLVMTREANIQWLIKMFKSKGLTLKKHIARQFTELYTRVSSPLLKIVIHSFNNFWFKYVKIPYPAFGNLLIFRKKE